MEIRLSDPLQVLSRTADRAWIVGGAVRDRVLGRPTTDYDVAVVENPRAHAQALARAMRAHTFKLSGAFGAWRVIARDRSWQIDLLALNGPSIEADLARRDLTINALAEPLAGGELVDPFGGLEDLRARRLRMVSSGVFLEDPLRTLRVARLASELGFEVDPRTRATAAASSRALRDVAPERVFAELRRIIIVDRALEGLAIMDDLGATAAVLPELAQLQGVSQSRYHHLDVFEHTRAVLAETIALERDPEAALCGCGQLVSDVLAQPLANDLTRWQALRFGALFHDIAKPATRGVTAEGRVTFFGHDEAGARMTRAALERLRASERLSEHVAALTRHHLRLGFLVHEMPLDRRATYRYLRACEPVEIDVTVLSVADRLATRGAGSEQAIAKHIALARELLGEAMAWRVAPPRPPLRGDELARALGLRPGPEIGQLLRELEEASFAGEIATRGEAIERAREVLDRLQT
jgi:putative nucleotidyltransferase with HDIG domain